MKRLLIAALLLASGVSPPALGYDPDRLSMLQSVGHCPDCDLSGVNLAGVNLTTHVIGGDDVDLSRANLSGANLSRTNLGQANLSGANLREANLSKAELAWPTWSKRTSRLPT